MEEIQALFERLKDEEEGLVLRAFSPEDGLNVGLHAVGHAGDIGTAALEVELCGRVVYSHYPTGTTPNNALWIARKRKMVHLRGMSSLRAWALLRMRGQTLANWELDSRDYAALGGGVPIRLAGTGIVGSVCASGLEHTQDHRLVVTCIKELMEHGEMEGRTAGQ